MLFFALIGCFFPIPHPSPFWLRIWTCLHFSGVSLNSLFEPSCLIKCSYPLNPHASYCFYDSLDNSSSIDLTHTAALSNNCVYVLLLGCSYYPCIIATLSNEIIKILDGGRKKWKKNTCLERTLCCSVSGILHASFHLTFKWLYESAAVFSMWHCHRLVENLLAETDSKAGALSPTLHCLMLLNFAFSIA